MANIPIKPVKTVFSDLIGCNFPVIAAPMFLVSNVAMVVQASNAGAVGAAPSLNWRTTAEFGEALSQIERQTTRPYAINLITSLSNHRLEADLQVVVRHKVPLIITSLGNPAKVIEAVHGYGGKVFCDVTTLDYAMKVQNLGCDGVIAVSSGAGGHAGHLSPLVFLPYLKKNLRIPIVAAGGIVTGEQMLAAMVLGADAVQIGTRFIATDEAPVAQDYKDAILQARPEDIVLTSRISGTPAAVINTPYIQKIGADMAWWEKALRRSKSTRHAVKLLRYILGTKKLEQAAKGTTWKQVWSAGQGAGLIDDILPVQGVVETIIAEYWQAQSRMQGRLST